jgi:hypothetical protein
LLHPGIQFVALVQPDWSAVGVYPGLHMAHLSPVFVHLAQFCIELKVQLLPSVERKKDSLLV